VIRHLYTRLSALVTLLCIPFFLLSQDIHYTNFGFSPFNLNPALTGVFMGDLRGNASYRSQWSGVPVSYTTFTGAFDMRLGNAFRNPDRRWSVGGMLNYDQAGWSHLSNTSLFVNGAYRLPLTANDNLSFGGQLGFNNRQFKTAELTWDDQYKTGRFDPSANSADVNTFDKTHAFGDISTGVNYHRQKLGKRSALDFGVGLYHLTKPNRSFDGDPDVKLERRFNIYANTNIQLTKAFDILLEGMYRQQGPHKENLLGLGGRLYLTQKRTKLLALQGGMSFRGKDAFSPHVGLIYNNWRATVNFDSNFSPFKTASNRLGGPEINVIYIFSKVPPGNYCPLCPTYL
jgi:type IX secretion system PorP/SprF family membrane protein